MEHEIETLKTDISLLAMEIAAATDDSQHRSKLLEVLNEKSKYLAELQAIYELPFEERYLQKRPSPSEQTIRNVATQGGDYAEGVLDKRVFNFLTIYSQSSPMQFQDHRWQQWQPTDWEHATHRYRNELVRLYGSMQILGMSRPVPLDSIFTDAYLLDKPGALRRFSIEDLQQLALHTADDVHDEPRQLGLDLVRNEMRLFILGKPGAGKTTFLKHLVTGLLQISVRNAFANTCSHGSNKGFWLPDAIWDMKNFPHVLFRRVPF